MKLETLSRVIRAMNRVYEIITDTSLDYKDKRHLLAAEAENSLPYVQPKEFYVTCLKVTLPTGRVIFCRITKNLWKREAST